MIFVLLDYDGGFEALVGTIVFQPIIALIISGLTTICCFVIGLPIRLNGHLRNWWFKYSRFDLILLLVSLILLVLSITFSETQSILVDEQQIEKSVPRLDLAIFGWFLLSFSIIHYFPRFSIKAILAEKKNVP
jgi:hypothetical protein